MPYSFNTTEDVQQMLQAIGVESIADLFTSIPPEIRLERELNLPPAMGELELTQHLSRLASKNAPSGEKVCFLGGGSYDHFVPAAVDAIASRGEFFTSYTPYQPEVSQGNLQVMFEYQTLICALSGMDVSNASLYDGGSAVAEAILMCMSATGRYGNVVTVDTVHPEYRQTVATYLENLNTRLITTPGTNGIISPLEVSSQITKETACVLIQYPNFFGCVEDVRAIAEMAHAVGAMLVVAFDPLSAGTLRRPGDLGADVVVAEGQSLGTGMQFGGPYLGILACRDQFVRRMPGRVAGQTVDRSGRRCWVLTLQTREQHIRREKATSNICTNQGLFALRAAIYLSLMGPRGMRDAGYLCLQKSHYAADRITMDERFELAFQQPFFKEFVVRDRRGEVARLLEDTCEQGYLAGIPLGRWYPDLEDCFLVAITEKRTKQEIDGLVKQLASANSETATTHA
ncbi:MAG: aminomethyl-transferring glycine dehydrogenase subunit GcvPA [Pirellulaceae bacterium]|nr:aminomethyl-transferring glycine dehydrogenase subunit GcvPA [Pirellulaceae bacterium]